MFVDASALVAIPPSGRQAIAASARYGKGTGHPAQPNMGDCFAHPMAEIHAALLHFNGDAFARTDLAGAC
jgi:ribonuclease VapC